MMESAKNDNNTPEMAQEDSVSWGEGEDLYNGMYTYIIRKLLQQGFECGRTSQLCS